VVEHVDGTCEALSSIPSVANKQKKKLEGTLIDMYNVYVFMYQ
jgi:hypothetical protein